MWPKWPTYLFLTTWILLQVPCTVICGLRHKTACYNFMLMVDPPCATTEMLLPTMFTLGVSSDVTCHSEITSGTGLRQKGVDEIRRCCQQRENDAVVEYCLPAMRKQLTDHYYRDFVNTCTASTTCQLSSPGVQHTDGEDYVTFTFDCVHKDTVLHIHHDSTHTGQEVYLYNDQHDGEAHANCIAYSHECDSHVIIQLAATRVVSPACLVDFTDGDVSVRVDCKNAPASSNCSSTMFESKSNYVNMSTFMTVNPGRQYKEFLWMRAKVDTGKNVTVVCGANIPSNVSLNCPTSTATTATTTTTTTTTTAAAAKPVTAAAGISPYKTTPVTSSATTGQNLPSSDATSARKMASQSHKTSSPQGTDTSTSTQEPQPSTPSKEVFKIGGSVGGAVLIAVIVTITVCVRRRKRNSSEKTDQKRGIMDESQENGYSSNAARNSGGDNGYMHNPIYEATDDYKMEQLHSSGHETVSPYALSGPARPGLSLRKNSWVTQSKLDYFDDILFNDKPGGEDSEERSDVQASDLYAKVNKSQGTNQVTDIYATVDKSGKIVRRTSGSCADEGEKDDVATMYAKVQK